MSAPGRLCCRDDTPFHHPPPPHGHHLSHPPKTSTSPTYQDIMLMDSLPPSGCPCRDCSIRREDSAAFHNLRLDRGDSFHWDREVELQQREVGLQRAREAELPRGSELHWERDHGLRRNREMSLHWERDREAELQWERDREAEYWHRRATVASYGPQGHDHPAFTFDPLPSGHPAYPEPSRSHVHSHLDLKYSSSSSGYQTPRQACPCSPYQPSPSESRGYASGYQSESTSPLPPNTSMMGSCSHNNGTADHNHHHHHHPDSQQSYSPDSHTDGLRSSGESVGWRDHITHGSFKRVHRDGHVACSTPSDMSGPPTPVHTSSPLRTRESPSPGGREYEIRTTDIIGSDSESSPTQDGHFCNNIVPETPESPKTNTEQSSLSLTKNTQSHTTTPVQTESLTHCTASTEPSLTTHPKQHCSTDTLIAPPVASVAPTTSNQEHCQVPTLPVHASPASDIHPQSGALTPPTLHPSEAAAVPSTEVQAANQPQTQTNGSTEPSSTQVNGSFATIKSHPDVTKQTTSNPTSASAPSSPQPGSNSMDGSPVSDVPVPGFATLGRRLMLSGSEPHHPNYLQHHGPQHYYYAPIEHSPSLDSNKRHYISGPTPQLHPASYSNYSTISIPLPHPQPPLPEKRHQATQPGSPSEGVKLVGGHVPPSNTQHQHHVTFSPTVGEIAPPAGQNDEVASAESDIANRVSVKFVQDSSRFWYKPGISREQAIAALKERDPGTFLVRDSNSFQGAYGLALKVATPPPNVNHNNKVSDPLEQLVRHFLIETGPRGVKIKGCQNEPYFGSLSALVYQHSITPISLPCALKIPEKDLIGEVQEVQPVSNISTAADLLKQGAACNVLYLNSVETESLTGPQAIAKATDAMLSRNPRPTATVVQFKVTSQGITLTDSQRRVFFRRHYPVNSVTFSSIDPKDRRWTNSDNTTVKVFGFVAKKPGSVAENVCHLFAELDPEQPASAIVNFINKVMLAQRR